VQSHSLKFKIILTNWGILGASPAGGGKLKVKNQNAKLWSRFAGLI
jgi:hypothetical protein